MIYSVVAVLLYIKMLFYFQVADKYNIIDKPNSRSSHSVITIRGGGIIFPFAMLLYVIFFNGASLSLFLGIMIISIVSFWDDVKSLPNRFRVSVHLLAVSAMLFSVNAFQLWPVWIIPTVFVLIIGTINAYNFMDGINGLTGLYSLITLAFILYLNLDISFTDNAFIICPMIASSIFLLFNFRKKAKCFAGDVGSVSIGFWVIALLLMVITQTGNLEYILFLSVYGVDAVLTILHRLVLRQNIFEAHRFHFYQVLANERKIPHVVVSSAYAIIQLLINTFLILTNISFVSTFFIVILPLSCIYLGFKLKWTGKEVQTHQIKVG